MSSMKLKLIANEDLPAEETQVNDLVMMEATLQAMLTDGDQFVNVISGSYEKLASKVLLSGRVPFFKDVVMHDTDCTDTIEVPPEISPDTTKVIIEYVYFIQPKVTLENAQSLLEAAGFFRIEDIWEFCDRFIAKRIVLTPENCIKVQAYAAVRSAKQLAKAAGQFILENLTDFFSSDHFKQLSQTQLETFLDLDEIDGLPSEETFWEALVEWVRADEQSRKTLVPHLIKLVRMPCLSTRYITRNVLPHPYIDKNQKCREMIQILMRYKMQTDLGDPKCRQAACAVEFKLNKRSGSEHQVSYIYIFTETWYRGVSNNEIYVLEVPGRKWDKLIPTNFPRAGDSRFTRTANVGDSIYCTRSDNSLTVYNPTTGLWTAVEADQGRPTFANNNYNLTSGSAGKKLYSCGVNCDKMELLYWCYDVNSNSWKEGKTVAMKKDYFKQKIHEYRAIQLGTDNDSELLCYFGSTRSNVGKWKNFLVLINPQTGQSTYGCALHENRMNGCVVTSYDGKMIVAGGVNTEIYDPKSDEWSSLPDMTTSRYGSFSLVVVKDCLYAVEENNKKISVEYLDLGAVNLKWKFYSELSLTELNNHHVRFAVVSGDIVSKQ